MTHIHAFICTHPIYTHICMHITCLYTNKHIHMHICTTLPTHSSLTHTHTHACEYAHTNAYPSHVCICISYTRIHMHMHTYPNYIQHVCICHIPSTYPTHAICTAARIHMHVYACPSHTPHRYISMYYLYTLHITHMYTHAYSITVSYPISFFLFSLWYSTYLLGCLFMTFLFTCKLHDSKMITFVIVLYAGPGSWEIFST